MDEFREPDHELVRLRLQHKHYRIWRADGVIQASRKQLDRKTLMSRTVGEMDEVLSADRRIWEIESRVTVNHSRAAR
jgi:hypothetical protein